MSAPLPLAAAAERLRRKRGRPPLTDEEKSRRAEQRRQRREAELTALNPRLLNIPASARYMSVSPWVIRDLIANGTLRRVLIPGAGGNDVRRVLLDRYDLDRLIEAAKA
jgi:hypothetical protein